MATIIQLSTHLSDLIAAGEVVERPASVVKELVENAIDAGATTITVEIRRGGMGLMRITDNGCGIAPEELPTAFLRHATSKLRSAQDLGAIATLGFRGEALAAISAVSRVRITTCQAGGVGAELCLEGGTPGTVEAVGAPQGTTICVEDLFYNTPARLKFMKKDSAETAAVNGLVQHLALSHPDIAFRFVKDGVDGVHTPGDGKLDSAIYGALGRDFAKTLVAVSGCGGEIGVAGFVSQPLQNRGSRGMQLFFVNGRFIKSPLLTAALEEGYRAQSMKGRFPACVLNVTLPVSQVDVNVHPAKTQVKFAKEREVFDALFHTVLDCLAKGATVPKESPAPLTAILSPATAKKEVFRTMDTATFRKEFVEKPAPKVKTEPVSPPPKPGMPQRWNQQSAPLRQGITVAPPPENWDSDQPTVVKLADSAPKPQPYALSKPAEVVPMVAPEPEVEAQQEVVPELAITPWRLVGEVLKTYIVCESDDGAMWLIDKHAAHERMHYNRLLAENAPPMTQQLIRPIPPELTALDEAILLAHLPLLAKVGFDCQDFGDGTMMVRGVPADVDVDDVTPTLEQLAQCLRVGKDAAMRREGLYEVMACKAAMKAGMLTSPDELQALVERVQSGEIRYCPHGRPIAVSMTGHQLEKLFKRA